MKILKIAHIIVMIFMLQSLFAKENVQDSAKSKNFVLNGYVKNMQIVAFQNVNSDWITGNLIHNRLDFTWYIKQSLKLTIGDRNRFFYGDFLKDITGYDKTFETDDGVVKLSKNVIDWQSEVMNVTLDRANLDYTNGKFEITFGRQRINWGQTFVWNPNDIFNTYSYLDFDYEEKPGSDALRAQYYINSTDRAEIAFKENNEKQVTAAGLYRFNKHSYDFQFLGGIFNNDYFMIGAGWSGEILNGGFRGEISYFKNNKKFSDSAGVWSAL